MRTPSLNLSSPITALHGVGPSLAKKLQLLGITTVEALVRYLPFRYEDYRTLTTIDALRIGQTATITGTIELIAARRSWKRRMTITEALVRDETGTIKVVWFNQPYLATSLKANDRVMLAGKVSDQYGSMQMVSPAYEKMEKRETLHVGRLVPIYPTTKGLSERQLRYFVSQVLPLALQVPDSLPNSLVAHERLMPFGEALQALHFPTDEHQRDAAIGRMKFDELLRFQVQRMVEQREQGRHSAPRIPFDEASIRGIVASLPFALTAGQKRAAWEILQDLEKPQPMYRLVEGDVGSGKTVVTALAAVNVIEAGWRAVMMAPTEILARQHFASLGRLLAHTDIPIVVWTSGFRELALHGKITKLTPHALAPQLPKHGALILGTHALLEHRAAIERLALVIVDEQHRFGVQARQYLLTTQGDHVPHFLSLTATPIPRSLALALTGDLSVSLLQTLPKGRKPIVTAVLQPEQRDVLYRRVDAHLAKGRQAFVLAPLIEPSDQLGIASALTLADECRERFVQRRVGVLHGKLPSKEKDAVLSAFAAHELDVLVATPVVEVGIDVPNATIMVIEGAERFGLAQLHQLRGRVGRGEHQSFCFLLPTILTPLAERRLDAVAHTKDGFRLAELDLSLRGPGDLVGTQQSGFLDFRFASLGDTALVEQARKAAERLLAEDPELTQAPLLAQSLDSTKPHKE